MRLARDPGQARCESHRAGLMPFYRPPAPSSPDPSSAHFQPFSRHITRKTNVHPVSVLSWPGPGAVLTRSKASSSYSVCESTSPRPTGSAGSALPDKLHLHPHPSSSSSCDTPAAELPLSRSAIKAPPAGLPCHGPATASESSSTPLTSCQGPSCLWIDQDGTPIDLRLLVSYLLQQIPPKLRTKHRANILLRSINNCRTRHWPKEEGTDPAMCDSPLFGDLGLGIHNSLPGGLFPFGFEYKDDPIDSLVDPGLTATPYTSSPNSSFPSPEQLGSSPPSCHDYFVDSRDSIGSLDAAAIAPDETVADNDTVAGKNSSHGPNNDSAKNNTSEPSKTTLSSALASSSSSTATTTPAAAPQPPANTSPIVTRTRKASSQNMDASGSTAQPRAKKQKTTIAVKLEPQEPQQRPQPQRQRQSSPPKRKPARRGSTAKKEDVAQRTKNLERNRIAASKCRQKKKEWVVELEEKKADLEARHNQLRIEYFELLGEVTSIKNELMAHAKCQDPNINFWIEKEAFKYVERCMDPVADRRPSMVGNVASGSSTLPSPAESHRSQQEPLPRPQGGINLDYMPDELLTGDLL